MPISSVYVNEYVSDIPLKRPAETFVDDPASLDEVLLDELEFDLSHDIKSSTPWPFSTQWSWT